MPSYSWTCTACEAGNSASDELCLICGCPAEASAAQVQSAKERLGLPSDRDPSFGALSSRDSLAVQALAVVLLFAGWLLTSYAAPLAIYAVGVLLVLAGLAVWRASKARK
jgi:hypothetical protein